MSLVRGEGKGGREGNERYGGGMTDMVSPFVSHFKVMDYITRPYLHSLRGKNHGIGTGPFPLITSCNCGKKRRGLEEQIGWFSFLPLRDF